MNLDLFILGGYGHFVWPAFIFTFLSCSVLYLKTKREFQKYERMLLKENKQSYSAEIKAAEGKKIAKETLFARKKYSTYYS